MLKQRVNQNPAQCTKKEQQVTQLIHGEHCAAPRRAYTAAGEQGHDRQWSATAAGCCAVGEFGGHDNAKALHRRDPVTLIAEQQAQAQGVDAPAEQDHAEHDQQPLQRKALQARPGVAAAEHDRNRHGGEQADQQQNTAAHAARSS